jgi:hypothetical protein
MHLYSVNLKVLQYRPLLICAIVLCFLVKDDCKEIAWKHQVEGQGIHRYLALV